MVAFFGWWLCPIFPMCNADVHTVIGTGIDLPKIEAPSKEDVAKWHQVYVEALTTLFDKHKASFGKADMSLKLM